MIEIERVKKFKGITIEELSKLPIEEQKYYSETLKNGEQDGVSIYGAKYTESIYDFFGEGVYYLPNNTIIDSPYNDNYLQKNNIFTNNDDLKNVDSVIKFDPERYIILDYFVLDMVDKKIELFDSHKSDGLIKAIGKIEDIQVENDKETGNRKIVINKVNTIIINKNNRIIGYENKLIENIGDDFLFRSRDVEELNIPNVKNIDDYFMESNRKLKNLNLPNVEKIGFDFMPVNQVLETVSMPKVKEVGDSFLEGNRSIEKIDLSSLNEECYSYLSDYIYTLNNYNKKNVK